MKNRYPNIGLFIALLNPLINPLLAQTNMVSYAGGSGKETFYDVAQLSDGSFLVAGHAEDLAWLPANVPLVQLTNTSGIPNALGTGQVGFLLHLSEDFGQILRVVHFPDGVVEDVRFIKFTSQPYHATGELYISCNTADSDANNGGYIIARLDNNFVNGVPTALVWKTVVWAKAYAKESHPWDVTPEGHVYHVSGESHAYDWSAMYKLNAQTGQRMVVPNWRTHWLSNNSEWRGTPASANPLGSISEVTFSGIVFKIWGRCELRSWNQTDFDATLPDGNGGTRKGLWPADFLFSTPCDPTNPTATGPGYSGYSAEACCPVWGASAVVVDKRNGNLYLGMNFKSYFNPQSTPDFEPAVLAFDSTGTMLWWNRLYHEITPAGDTVGSIPDQYVDALAIDYTHDQLVVGARSHGNNVENFWEGNTVAADPSAFGFQNQFTGSNGNIHESWLGKLSLNNGTLRHSSYMAELAEGTGGLGTAHPNPNLDGWPNPNSGWPDVNTTRMAKNALKVSSNGDVVVVAVGRRTITTANAYQKMVKPGFGGLSCWNSFVRMYNSELELPLYSSLIVGQWDTLTQSGGDNTEMFGAYKTGDGVVCVGRQKADANGAPAGNPLPVANVPSWGSSTPSGQSAVLVYYRANLLENPDDEPLVTSQAPIANQPTELALQVFPVPALTKVNVFVAGASGAKTWNYQVLDGFGRTVLSGPLLDNQISLHGLAAGVYHLCLSGYGQQLSKRLVVSQ